MTGKIPNKVAYNFSLWRPLDPLGYLGILAAFYACIEIIDIISFALVNQKVYHNKKY